MNFTFAESTEWWLEISPEVREVAWQQSQECSTPGGRWNAYLNQLCLSAFLPWFQSEYVPGATSWVRDEEVPSFWEVVNGSAIIFSRNHASEPTRLVLIPSDAIEDEALEVLQEWVDIPSWAGDYYLAVQIKPDEDWMRIWGYTTHQKLKAGSRYHAGDRTYYLNETDLSVDMNAFWITVQSCPQLQTKGTVEGVSAIAPVQAENLIQRLGNPAVIFPRLEVPFATWGAILENTEWRSRFFQQRTQSVMETSKLLPIRLGQWLQNQVEIGWRSLNSEDLALNVRSVLQPNTSSFDAAQVKLLDVAFQLEQTIALVVGLTMEAEDRANVRVQIYPTGDISYLPANLTLSVLSNGEALQVVQATDQDNYIQLGFRCPIATEFSLQVAIDDWTIQEDFVV